MTRLRAYRLPAGLLVACALSLATSLPARAGNLDSFFFGPEAMLTGGAVLATATGGEAVWYNPAGLAATDRNSFDLTITAYNLRLRKISDGLEAVFPSSRETEDLDGTDLIVAAAALTSTFRPSDDVLLGFGVYLTDKDRVRIDNELSVMTPEGAQLGFTGQLSADGEVYRVGPSLGVRLSDRLRLGFGLFAIYGRLTQRIRLGLSGLDPNTDPPTRVAELAEIDAERTRVGLEPVLSLQWDPLERLSVGLVVRGPGILVAEQLRRPR